MQGGHRQWKVFLNRWTTDSIVLWFSDVPSFPFPSPLAYLNLPYTTTDHSVENMFCCINGICAYVNESRHGLLRHQARFRCNFVRDAGKSGERLSSKPSVQLETTSHHFKYLSFCSFRMERDMHDGISHKKNESGEKEKIPTWVLDLVKCLLALCSSSVLSKVGKLISVVCWDGARPKDVSRARFKCDRLP